jgi:hypothetical protein
VAVEIAPGVSMYAYPGEPRLYHMQEIDGRDWWLWRCLEKLRVREAKGRG